MKNSLEAPMAFDRVSTHEELHQVLALLSEPGSSVTAEASTESRTEREEKSSLREATSDLWLDASAEEDEHDEHEDETESDLQGELYQWAETIAGKSERIN